MLVNTTDKRAVKQAIASLVQRHEVEPGRAAVGVVEAIVHFGLQAGNLSSVAACTGYAEGCKDGPNALWDTLSLSGKLVRRAKRVLSL